MAMYVKAGMDYEN